MRRKQGHQSEVAAILQDDGVHKGMLALPDTPVPYSLMQEVSMGNQRNTSKL